MESKDYHRMLPWLLLAATFYAVALSITPPAEGGHPAMIQTAFWKLGHITVSAYLGYWIDRHLFGRYVPTDSPYTFRAIARAIVVAAAILGMAFGL